MGIPTNLLYSQSSWTSSCVLLPLLPHLLQVHLRSPHHRLPFYPDQVGCAPCGLAYRRDYCGWVGRQSLVNCINWSENDHKKHTKDWLAAAGTHYLRCEVPSCELSFIATSPSSSSNRVLGFGPPPPGPMRFRGRPTCSLYMRPLKGPRPFRLRNWGPPTLSSCSGQDRIWNYMFKYQQPRIRIFIHHAHSQECTRRFPCCWYCT